MDLEEGVRKLTSRYRNSVVQTHETRLRHDTGEPMLAVRFRVER
jgi:uncharacterized lipoprotein YmbA